MARILVVDDDAALREAVRAVLETEGFEVLEASQGRSAIRIVREQSIDLIICDIFMPDQDGLETLRELRREFRGIPVIAVSGGGSKGGVDVLAMAKHLGAAHVIDKPLRRAVLLDAVRDLLTRPRDVGS
jgi:CheY-like chemotaxis protein